MKRESTLLFNTYDLDSVLLAQAKKIKELTSAVPPQTLLEKSVEEFVPNIEKEIRVEPLDLFENDVSVAQEETKVDVSQDFMRHIINRSRPFYIDGLRVSYYVPFKGDKELFKCKPNKFTFNPPYARVKVSSHQPRRSSRPGQANLTLLPHIPYNHSRERGRQASTGVSGDRRMPCRATLCSSLKSVGKKQLPITMNWLSLPN